MNKDLQGKTVQLEEVILDPQCPIGEQVTSSNQTLQGMVFEEISAVDAAKVIAEVEKGLEDGK